MTPPESQTVVYAIRHVSGKQYIGSTARWKRRKAEHLGRLRSGRHCNNHLQNAWALYGEAEFEFVVLETIANPTELLTREQYWIDTTQAVATGYNLLVQAGSRRDTPLTAEHRAKISAAKVGHAHSPETVERIKLARARQVMDPTAMAKTHAAVRGKPRDEATRAKISTAHAGKRLSDETRAKLAAVNTGKRLSDETRAKQSAALKAHWAAKRAAQTPTTLSMATSRKETDDPRN